MKLFAFVCLVATVAASPQFNRSPQPSPRQIATLRDNRINNNDGTFNYEFETENGIQEQRTGTTGTAGQSNMQGTFSFPLPDGTFAEVRYVADENGFRAESPLIPAIPEHALAQIRFAEEERGRGGRDRPRPRF